MHSVRDDIQVCAASHAHQLTKVHVQLQLDLLLVFTFVSVLNELDCMCVHNDMHVVESLTCDHQHFSPRLLYVSFWDGYLTCTSTISSMSARCAHCYFWFCCNWFVYLCSFMFFLELLLQHMQLIFCSIFYLRAIFVSCHHFIAGVSKVSFIINGTAWACNFFLPPFCQQPSSFIHCIWYVVLTIFHDASHCDATAWCPCLRTTWCLRG